MTQMVVLLTSESKRPAPLDSTPPGVPALEARAPYVACGLVIGGSLSPLPDELLVETLVAKHCALGLKGGESAGLLGIPAVAISEHQGLEARGFNAVLVGVGEVYSPVVIVDH